MNIEKKELGKALKRELNLTHDINKIANWAYEIFINSRGDFSPEINDILHSIFLMEAGPEFEYSIKELEEMADKMIEED